MASGSAPRSYDTEDTPTYRDDEGRVSQEVEALLAPDDSPLPPQYYAPYKRSFQLRSFLIRALALLCACSLSVGSHYGSYILSPLKSRLSREMGTSNTEFSLLISAFSLNSTWTPLVGGIMASRLGTTFTSVLATGVILSGLTILLIGDVVEDVRLMTLGMFVFGLGVSPLSVVQETIIVRFFKSHGLGLSMAFGLVAGKAASFVAARTSYPLSEHFGPHAPFWAAAILAVVSFIVNLAYVSASKWLVDGAGAELEAPELREEARHIEDISEAQALEQVAAKKRVKFSEIAELGDVFWAYIALNVLCGAIWHPFAQLAPNVIEHRFHLSEQAASSQASFLLAGSMLLYPTVGFLIDRLKRPYLILALFATSSLLTLFAFSWLALPSHITGTAWPAIVSFATGFGFSPLLLVVLVPQLVPSKYISTTLGAHKSLEQTGTVMSQTLAGLILDVKRRSPNTLDPRDPITNTEDASIQRLLNTFLLLNTIQLIGIGGLWFLDRRQKELTLRRRSSLLQRHISEEQPPTIKAYEDDSEEHSDQEPLHLARRRSIESPVDCTPPIVASSDPLLSSSPDNITRPKRVSRRSRRGRVFTAILFSLVIAAWLLFLVTAWVRLRSKAERGSDGAD
ncbi:MFS general substrate transporter [Artomyces pyxidatus]|uniref:MFS general substrate transporter n=1 Tax=Artomyces pyxidatus TaxID=48021 RepID=A0ACB8TH01_9AGAM|nr:MFS general substrate transporter [Artomyces pyxidatus]